MGVNWPLSIFGLKLGTDEFYNPIASNCFQEATAAPAEMATRDPRDLRTRKLVSISTSAPLMRTTATQTQSVKTLTEASLVLARPDSLWVFEKEIKKNENEKVKRQNICKIDKQHSDICFRSLISFIGQWTKVWGRQRVRDSQRLRRAIRSLWEFGWIIRLPLPFRIREGSREQ